MILKLLKNISLYYLLFSLYLNFIFLNKILTNSSLINYYSIYLIFSITLLIFSIYSFWLNSEVKKNLNLVLFSVLIGLYIIEFFLVFENFSLKNKSKLDFYTNYKNNENNNVVTVIPPFLHISEDKELFPLGGISNVETIYCNELGFFTIYKSDRYGFNNSDEVWEENIFDYLLLGDSFVHGACVENKFNISNNLKKLSQKNVINLGMSGNSPLINYASLKEYLDVNKTKRVIFVFTEDNDLEGLHFELQDKILLNYLIDKNFSQNLKVKQNQLNEILYKKFNIEIEKELNISKKINYKPFIYFLKFYSLRTFTLDKFITKTKEQPNTYSEFENILNQMKIFLDKNDINFYFVYLPSYSRFLYKKYNTIKYAKVLNIIKKNQINLIDIYNDLLKDYPNKKSLFALSGSGHLNRKGYQLVSEIIYEKILEFEK